MATEARALIASPKRSPYLAFNDPGGHFSGTLLRCTQRPLSQRRFTCHQKKLLNIFVLNSLQTSPCLTPARAHSILLAAALRFCCASVGFSCCSSAPQFVSVEAVSFRASTESASLCIASAFRAAADCADVLLGEMHFLLQSRKVTILRF